MKTYPLTVISPEGQIYDGNATSLIAQGMAGLFGVLAGHAPMMMYLSPGVLQIKEGSNESIFATDSGILEVHPDGRVLILIDGAMPCSSVEEAKKNVSKFVVTQSNE